MTARPPPRNTSLAIAADGQLLAVSDGVIRATADRLRTFTLAFGILARAAGNGFDLGRAARVITDFEGGYLLVTVVNAHCLLGIVVTNDADLGALAYEVAVFANQVGRALTDVVVRDIGIAVQTSAPVVTGRATGSGTQSTSRRRRSR